MAKALFFAYKNDRNFSTILLCQRDRLGDINQLDFETVPATESLDYLEGVLAEMTAGACENPDGYRARMRAGTVLLS